MNKKLFLLFLITVMLAFGVVVNASAAGSMNESGERKSNNK